MLAISTPMAPPLSPFSDSHNSSTSSSPADTLSNMTTLLPAPSIHTRPSLAPAQRPKLSINTRHVRSFGKSSTSLRLDTLSAVSPTARNTFSNAYEPKKSSVPALMTDHSDDDDDDSSSLDSCSSSLNSSPDHSSSASSTGSAIPYSVSYNLTSILTNSPIKTLRHKVGSSRPFFPTPKKVAFRAPLEEEIKTTRFVLSHADTMAVEEDDDEDLIEIPPNAEDDIDDIESSTPSPIDSGVAIISSAEVSPVAERPRLGLKRDSWSDDEGNDGDNDDDDDAHDAELYPVTPVAGRNKRRCEWTWTIDSVQPTIPTSPQSGVSLDA